jgi:DNA-binding response OmpR family regulator
LGEAVLIVARDATIRATLARLLLSEGIAIEVAESRKRAQDLIAKGGFAAAIISPSRFGAAGDQLVQYLGEATGTVIVVLESAAELGQIECKPFVKFTYLANALGEVIILAEVRRALAAKLHRSEAGPGCSDVLGFLGFVLDIPRRVLIGVSGEQVKLTRAEFDVLVTLARNAGAVLSRDQLRRSAGGRGIGPYDRSVDMLIGRLRRKIEADPGNPAIILTLPGAGYAFGPDPRPIQRHQR